MDPTTFGDRPCDLALAKFLDSLRESPHEAKKVRRQVLALLHRLNLTTKTLFGLFFQYPISSSHLPNHPAAWVPPQTFQNHLLGLVEKEFRDQVRKKPWRSPLKTLTHTCIKERFRFLRRSQLSHSPLLSNNLDKLAKFHKSKNP